MSENSAVTIGQKLKDAREAKGLSLDDLQQQTKIQKRYLSAIEAEDFDELPGDFYVRAFIKQYANGVGLDGGELLKEYDGNLPSTNTQEYSDKVAEESPSTRIAQRRTEDKQARRRGLLPIIGIAAVVLVIIIGIWVAVAHNSRQTANNVDSSSVSVSGASSSSAASSSTKPEKKPATKTASIKAGTSDASNQTFTITNADKTRKLVLSATSTAWTTVNIDGTSKFQGSLQSGADKTISIPASAKTVTLNLGNSNATKIRVNGKTVPLKKGTTTTTATTQSGTQGTNGAQAASSAQTTTRSTVQNITLNFK